MSKNLEQRVEDVLAITLERDNPGFSIEHEISWQRRMKAALAQVFFLGMSVGWDKCVAFMADAIIDAERHQHSVHTKDHGSVVQGGGPAPPS